MGWGSVIRAYSYSGTSSAASANLHCQHFACQDMLSSLVWSDLARLFELLVQIAQLMWQLLCFPSGHSPLPSRVWFQLRLWASVSHCPQYKLHIEIHFNTIQSTHTIDALSAGTERESERKGRARGGRQAEHCCGLLRPSVAFHLRAACKFIVFQAGFSCYLTVN